MCGEVKILLGFLERSVSVELGIPGPTPMSGEEARWVSQTLPRTAPSAT